MASQEKTPDMFKDFRAFNLRKQDVAHEIKLGYYGDISERYTFIDFNSSETEPFSNLLDDIYYEQYKYRTPSYLQTRSPDYSQRDRQLISIVLSNEQKKSSIKNVTEKLKSSITDKQEAEEYLTEKYMSILSEHKKITLFPFAFYLSDRWVKRYEEDDYTFTPEVLKMSLEELKRRFDTIIKTMKSNSEYKTARAYIRTIVFDELYRPFYFVIFFFKGDDLGNEMPKKIWHQWLDSGTRDEDDYDQRGVFYPFDDKYIPEANQRCSLIISKPEDGIRSNYEPLDVYRDFIDEVIGSRYAEKPTSMKNIKSDHLTFFHFLARRINKMHPNKVLVFSNDFTYLTNKEKKEQSDKRKAEKENETNKAKAKKNTKTPD